MKTLAVIAESAGLTSIDLHLADLLGRRAAADTAEIVAVTAALLSHERGRGHSCLDLERWSGRSFRDASSESIWRAPDRDTWEGLLAASSLVGGPNDRTPLIQDGTGRVYLRRYFLAERRVAAALRNRQRQVVVDAPDDATSQVFRALFSSSGAETGGVDWQAVAAAAALSGPVTLISGGPGTGKTTTVTRILALLLAADPDLRIALAAPTGKAASRLGESITAQLESLPVDEDLRVRIPTRASTIHRLLGYLPRGDRFRHDADRPLACDVLVVDEASMVDLLVMDALLAALPESARVILLGDRDQLTSVETGHVFGDLCSAAGLDRSASAYSPAFVDHFRRLVGDAAEGLEVEARASLAGASDEWGDTAVELRRSYRFEHRPGIGRLAATVRDQDADGALHVLADARRPDVDRQDPAEDPRQLLAPLEADLDHYLAADSPEQALRRLGRFQVLCATRHGPFGVAGLDAAFDSELRRRGLAGSGRWYRGRPIVVTANDYQVRLFNGDVGVCWPEDDRFYAWFAAGDAEGLRRVPLARVPGHATAWAMTVHKSQGSEFDRVVLVLPDRDIPLLTRELLYTGVTRAREQLHLIAGEDVLRAAIGRRTRRASGLAAALLGYEPQTPSASEIKAASVDPSDDEAVESGAGQMSLF